MDVQPGLWAEGSARSTPSSRGGHGLPLGTSAPTLWAGLGPVLRGRLFTSPAVFIGCWVSENHSKQGLRMEKGAERRWSERERTRITWETGSSKQTRSMMLLCRYGNFNGYF